MYINEVKRDRETLKKVAEFQACIENLVSSLSDTGGGHTPGRGKSQVSSLAL